jgi:hypothetical protein
MDMLSMIVETPIRQGNLGVRDLTIPKKALEDYRLVYLKANDSRKLCGSYGGHIGADAGSPGVLAAAMSQPRFLTRMF